MADSERKDNGAVLWLPFFWLLLSCSRGRLSTTRSVFAEAQASSIFPFLYGALILIAVFVLLRRGILRREIFRNNPWILCLYVFMGLSILWSAYPYISFKRWVKTGGVLVMVLILMTEEDPLASLSTVLRRLTFAAVPLSLFLCLFVPEYGRQDLGEDGVVWAGIATSKNSLAQMALVCVMFYTWLMLQRDRPKRPFLDPLLWFLSLALLIGTLSITCYLTFLVFLGVMLLIHFFRAERRHTGIVLAYISVLGIFAFLVLDGLMVSASLGDVLTGVFKRDATLTGRTVLWADVLAMGMEHPLRGHGFGAFWYVEEGLEHASWYKHDWRPGDAHNGFVDVFLDMGFVGFTLLMLIIFRAYRDISAGFAADFEFSRLRLLLFSAIIVHNFSETSLCYLNHPFWFLFLFSVMRPLPPPGVDGPAPARARP